MFETEESRLSTVAKLGLKAIEKSAVKTNLEPHVKTDHRKIGKLQQLKSWNFDKETKEVAMPPVFQASYERPVGSTPVVLKDSLDELRNLIVDFTANKLRPRGVILKKTDKTTDAHIIVFQMLQNWLLLTANMGDESKIKHELTLMRDFVTELGTQRVFMHLDKDLDEDQKITKFLKRILGCVKKSISECDILLQDALLNETLKKMSNDLGEMLIVLGRFLGASLSKGTRALELTDLNRSSIAAPLSGQKAKSKTVLEGMPLELLRIVFSTDLYRAVLPEAGDDKRERQERIVSMDSLNRFKHMLVSKNPLITLEFRDRKVTFIVNPEVEIGLEGIDERFKKSKYGKIIRTFKILCGIQHEFARLRLYTQNAAQLCSQAGNINILSVSMLRRSLKMIARHCEQLIPELREHINFLNQEIEAAEGEKENEIWRQNHFLAQQQETLLKGLMQNIEALVATLGRIVDRTISPDDYAAIQNSLELMLVGGEFYDNLEKGLLSRHQARDLYWLLFLNNAEDDIVTLVADVVFSGTGTYPAVEKPIYWENIVKYLGELSENYEKAQQLFSALSEYEEQHKKEGLSPLGLLLKVHLSIVLRQSPSKDLQLLFETMQKYMSDGSESHAVYGYLVAYLSTMASKYKCDSASFSELASASQACLEQSAEGRSLRSVLDLCESAQPKAESTFKTEDLQGAFKTTQRRKGSKASLDHCVTELVTKQCPALLHSERDQRTQVNARAILHQVVPSAKAGVGHQRSASQLQLGTAGGVGSGAVAASSSASSPSSATRPAVTRGGSNIRTLRDSLADEQKAADQQTVLNGGGSSRGARTSTATVLTQLQEGEGGSDKPTAQWLQEARALREGSTLKCSSKTTSRSQLRAARSTLVRRVEEGAAAAASSAQTQGGGGVGGRSSSGSSSSESASSSVTTLSN